MIRMGLRLITRTRNITGKKRDQIHFIKLLSQDVGIIQANYIGGVIQISIQFFDCISLKRLAVR
jgi:hypothetical protein